MARKMRKFSEGGAQGRYDRRMADIKKDFTKDSAGKTGRAAEVLAAKRDQRIADAEDDRAKRTGADRTATRKAEYEAEQRLSRTRKFGADKPTAAAEPVKASAPAAAATPVAEKAKPSSFGAAFKEARSRLGAGKTFTYNGKSFTTNIAGEGRKPALRTDTGAGASSLRTNKGASNNAIQPISTAKGEPSVRPISTAKTEAKPVPLAAKGAPVAKRYETPAQAAARVAKLTGGSKRLNSLAGVFGIDSISNAKARASLLATREAEKTRNAARGEANRKATEASNKANAAARAAKLATLKKAAEAPGASGFDKGRYKSAMSSGMVGAAGGKIKRDKIMKKMAKGGSTPPQPTPADRARSKAQLESLKKAKVSAEEARVLGSANRSEGRRYAVGGVTKEMPSSKAMGSLGMAKGGKAKMKPAAKGKAKGNPFAATKFGAAMMKKGADAKGRAMPKFAKGGSIDGCAVKGKTKTSMVKMARGGKTC